jgi:hypothetical protein
LSKESSALTDEQKDQLASADKVERFKKYIRESGMSFELYIVVIGEWFE